MKIGILTQPLHNNYGGILQCYALQTLLEGMGHDVTVLNRRFAGPGCRLLIMRLGSLVKCAIRKFILGQRNIAIMSPWAENYNIHKPSETEKKRDAEIQRFIREYIHLSEPLLDSKELLEYVEINDVECIVVGSDQVWRENYSPCIEDFFTGFLPENDKRLKIAYAASFGTADEPISRERLNDCVRLARRFSAISVRERFGVEIMARDFGLEAKLSLDPTLLLAAEKYRFPVEETEKGDLLSYILDSTDDKDDVIQDAAGVLRLKCKKICLSDSVQDDASVLPSVEEWLSSFANAGFVVTDSFHGCVFSIINHKPFIAIANESRGLERFTSLLGASGLMDRLVFDFNEYKGKRDLLLSPINFEDVETMLQPLLQDSLEFLNMLGYTSRRHPSDEGHLPLAARMR